MVLGEQVELYDASQPGSHSDHYPVGPGGNIKIRVSMFCNILHQCAKVTELHNEFASIPPVFTVPHYLCMMQLNVVPLRPVTRNFARGVDSGHHYH